MSKDLVLIPTAQEMQVIESICKYSVDSKYFQAIGGLPGAICIALYAREIGVPPVTALMGGFSNVQGRISMSAELMHSLIRSAGHRVKINKNDNTVCEIYCKRCDTGDEYTSTYTIEDARRANLVKPGGSYEKNPSDMLFARCISRLKRRLVPDLAPKAIVEGDLEDAEATEESVTITTEDVSIREDKAKETAAFKEKFKEIENMDFDLDDFVKFISDKSGKSADDTIKQAIKHTDKFSKSYLKWVEEKIAMEVKPVDVKAEQIDLVNLK